MVEILPLTVHSFNSLGNICFSVLHLNNLNGLSLLINITGIPIASLPAGSGGITSDQHTCRIATETIWLYVAVPGPADSRFAADPFSDFIIA